MSIHTSYSTVARDRALAQQRQDREDREAQEQRAQEERDEANRKIRDARLQALDDKKAAERAERLATEDASFIDTLRRRYLAADPTATEESFIADLPEIRRQARIAAAVTGPSPDGELNAQRAAASHYF